MTTTLQKIISIYARVSTAKQEEDGTVETQLLAIEDYAKEKGYIIVDRYIDDGWSGDILARPELDRLRQEAKDAKWEAVLIYDPDRLARRYAYQEFVKDEITENGKDVLFVTMKPAQNSEDKILNGVRGLFAEYERIKIAERMRLGKLRKVREGHLLVSKALYGFDYIPKVAKVDGYYVVNEERAKIVKMVFDWVANEGFTIQKVILRLQALDIKPQNSKRGVWSGSTIGSMLKNRAYIGQAKWGSSYAVIPDRPLKDTKYKKIKKTSRRIRPKEDWYFIPCPRIIEDEVFDKAQEQMRINFERNKRNKVNSYLLSSLIYCNCTKRRTGEGVQQNRNLYYRCTDRIKSFPLPRNCFEKGLNAKLADSLVWDKVATLMTDPNLLSKQLTRWIADTNNKGKVQGVDVEYVKGEMQKLKDQEDRYNKAYGVGAISLEQLQSYTEPIRKKVGEFQTKLSDQLNKDRENRSEMILPTEENIKNFSAIVKNHIFQLNFEQKRAIILSTIQKVVGNDKKLLVSGYIPLNLINNYEYKTSYRNCWVAKCREEYTF